MNHPVFAEALVAQVLVAHPNLTAEQTARLCIRLMLAMGITNPARLEQWERDAHAYDLRGKGMTCSVIARRLGVDSRTVFRIMGGHQALRRAALKVAI